MRIRRLIGAFAGHQCHFVGILLRQLKYVFGEYADTKGSDQTLHLRNLIRAFALRFYFCIIYWLLRLNIKIMSYSKVTDQTNASLSNLHLFKYDPKQALQIPWVIYFLFCLVVSVLVLRFLTVVIRLKPITRALKCLLCLNALALYLLCLRIVFPELVQTAIKLC